MFPQMNDCCSFEKALAAEALRRNENDTQKALDDLTNPEVNATMQVLHSFFLRKLLNHMHTAYYINA